jgi:hypothetical protein
MSVDPETDMSVFTDQGQYEDELLWGDDPNKHYFRYFMKSKRKLDKDDLQDCESSQNSSKVDGDVLTTFTDRESYVDQVVLEMTRHKQKFNRLDSPRFSQGHSSLASNFLSESQRIFSTDNEFGSGVYTQSNDLSSVDGSRTTMYITSNDKAKSTRTSSDDHREKLANVATEESKGYPIDNFVSRNEEALEKSRRGNWNWLKIFVALALLCCIGGVIVGANMLLSEKRSKIAARQQSIDPLDGTETSKNRTARPSSRSPNSLAPTKSKSFSPSSTKPSPLTFDNQSPAFGFLIPTSEPTIEISVLDRSISPSESVINSNHSKSPTNTFREKTMPPISVIPSKRFSPRSPVTNSPSASPVSSDEGPFLSTGNPSSKTEFPSQYRTLPTPAISPFDTIPSGISEVPSDNSQSPSQERIIQSSTTSPSDRESQSDVIGFPSQSMELQLPTISPSIVMVGMIFETPSGGTEYPSTEMTTQPLTASPSEKRNAMAPNVPSVGTPSPSERIKTLSPTRMPSTRISEAPSTTFPAPAVNTITGLPTRYSSQAPIQSLTEVPSLQAISELNPNNDILNLLTIMSNHDQGKALRSTNTPQFMALTWLTKDSAIGSYTNLQKVQRFVLATLYYSTSGPNWKISDGWLSDAHECYWFSSCTLCDDHGLIRELDLHENSLSGTLPVELSWLQYLIRMDLRENLLSGHIPTEFGRLSSLGDLQLTRNALTGELPTELAKLNNLGK